MFQLPVDLNFISQESLIFCLLQSFLRKNFDGKLLLSLLMKCQVDVSIRSMSNLVSLRIVDQVFKLHLRVHSFILIIGLAGNLHFTIDYEWSRLFDLGNLLLGKLAR